MYNILELYEKPYEPRYPVIGLDEKPKQLLADKRQSISMVPGHHEKCDYEYINQKGNSQHLYRCGIQSRETNNQSDDQLKLNFKRAFDLHPLLLAGVSHYEFVPYGFIRSLTAMDGPHARLPR